LFVLWFIKKCVSYMGKGLDLNWLVIVHNSLLSLFSAAIFSLLLSVLIQMMEKSSFFEVLCDPNSQWTKGRVYYFYYINYLMKYVELLDTVLLVVRNKPTPFLHVYHHAFTLILCFTQLTAQSCCQWLPIVINLFIHIIMYFYYTLHALKVEVWWKKYLTVAQIFQFIVALIVCTFTFGLRVLYTNGYAYPPCHGDVRWGFFGLGVLLTYLALFIHLFMQTYYSAATKHKQQNKPKQQNPKEQNQKEKIKKQKQKQKSKGKSRIIGLTDHNQQKYQKNQKNQKIVNMIDEGVTGRPNLFKLLKLFWNNRIIRIIRELYSCVFE